eukprot:TRINITY_DN14530_c0_g1_i1.p1 TRINITY_DN14530_c0_g1~~TRINITY_DN14530_c0_g1_i1.p1  ORF type:complete len:446 (+),score=73.19 TRINITY_DN14530_c0_g1_i1:127-1338(+)
MKLQPTCPVFNVDGVTYSSIKAGGGLYFVSTTRNNVSPAFSMELLLRLATLFKDYCGVLDEESLRKNFVLIYELLDEALDFGYPQTTSTELLKPFVFNEPAPVPVTATEPDMGLFGLALKPHVAGVAGAHKPVTLNTHDERSHKNEIYVDLVERLTVLVSPQGNVLRSEIDGFIKMHSYLKGNPEMRLGLNQDLVVGQSSEFRYGGGSTIDAISFHECANISMFEADKTVVFHPPDGEFVVLNYHISQEFPIPFRVQPVIEDLGEGRVDLIVKIRLDLKDDITANNIVVRCPIPKSTISAKCELTLPGIEYRVLPQNSGVEWVLSSFQGGSEIFLRSRLAIHERLSETVRKEFGPINMNFEISMHNCSNVRIRFLRVVERDKSYNPYRWVRNITQAASFVVRV